MITRTPRFIPFLAVPLALVALAACGDDTDTASTTPPADTAGTLELDGNAFLAESAEGIEVPEAASLRIEFEDGRVAVSGGCNMMSGDYSLNGDVLVVGPMMSTQMACDEPLMTLDEEVGVFLASSPTVALAGETLTLTSGDITMTFTEEADLPIDGTVWTVDGVVTDDAVSSLPAEAEATLVFADGEVQVATGCNTGSGSAVITGTMIEFGPIATTKMACEEPLMELESHILGVLTGAADYTIEGSSLQLTNGGIGLTLKGAPAE